MASKIKNLGITRSQAEILQAGQDRLVRAERDLRIAMNAILAGFNTPENARVEEVSVEPPRITLSYPEEPDGPS